MSLFQLIENETKFIPPRATPVGYALLPKQTFEEWQADGEKLNLIDKWKNFAIGDWLLQGVNRFGEVCYQTVGEYEWGSYSKLTKLVWVARNVPPENRNMGLTWTHHYQVASLSTTEQIEWLRHAERHRLTSDELKNEIAASKQLPPILPLPELPHTNGNGYHDDGSDDVPFGTLPHVMAEQDDQDTWLDRPSYVEVRGPGGDVEESFRIAPDEELRIVKTGLRLAAANHAVSDDPDYDGDEWYTPAEYIEAARRIMGSIDLDPASCDEAQEVVKAAYYYTKQDDGLAMPWFGRVWLNPPYSTPLIRQFVTKLIEEHNAGNITEAVILTNNSSDTAWFHDLLCRYPACFTRGRVQFWRADHETFGARQGQTLFYLGENITAFRNAFARFGQVVARL